MRRLHLALGLIAVVGLGVSLSAPWWVITLGTGAQVAVTGLSASASASSLLAATGAAFGLGFVVRGLWRRVVAALQVVLLAGVATLWWQVRDDPSGAARADITTLTGIAGESSLLLVSTVVMSSFFWVGYGSAVVGIVSGALGVVMPDAPMRASRYERHRTEGESADPVTSWDRLSDGEDPTER